MTLREYIANLQKFVEENPEALEYEVIYASDDEGNNYESVCHEPTTGNYRPNDRSIFGKFTPKQLFEEEPEEHIGKEFNAVCIN